MNSSQLTEFFQTLSTTLHSEQRTKARWYLLSSVLISDYKRQQNEMPAWEASNRERKDRLRLSSRADGMRGPIASGLDAARLFDADLLISLVSLERF
jgi:hypothetical protein